MKNQYEVDAYNLIAHYKKLSKINQKSVISQIRQNFKSLAESRVKVNDHRKSAALIHLIAFKIEFGTNSYEYILPNRKLSCLDPENFATYDLWLSTNAKLKTIEMQTRAPDLPLQRLQGGSFSLQRSNIQYDQDDLPQAKLTVAASTDWDGGSSYKNTRQGSYMGGK